VMRRTAPPSAACLPAPIGLSKLLGRANVVLDEKSDQTDGGFVLDDEGRRNRFQRSPSCCPSPPHPHLHVAIRPFALWLALPTPPSPHRDRSAASTRYQEHRHPQRPSRCSLSLLLRASNSQLTVPTTFIATEAPSTRAPPLDVGAFGISGARSVFRHVRLDG
jgi:hypothetical protein